MHGPNLKVGWGCPSHCQWQTRRPARRGRAARGPSTCRTVAESTIAASPALARSSWRLPLLRVCTEGPRARARRRASAPGRLTEGPSVPVFRRGPLPAAMPAETALPGGPTFTRDVSEFALGLSRSRSPLSVARCAILQASTKRRGFSLTVVTNVKVGIWIPAISRSMCNYLPSIIHLIPTSQKPFSSQSFVVISVWISAAARRSCRWSAPHRFRSR